MSFIKNRFNTSIRNYKFVVEAYNESIKSVVELKANFPIFPDTSLLLKYYEISFDARKKLLNYLIRIQDKFVLSQQVQFEFLKNRQSIIDTFRSELTDVLPSGFKTDLGNKILNFRNINKIRLQDYPLVLKKLERIEKEVVDLGVELKGEVEHNNDKHPTDISNDELFKLLQSINKGNEVGVYGEYFFNFPHRCKSNITHQ